MRWSVTVAIALVTTLANAQAQKPPYVEEALAALEMVPYKDCGSGGSGRVEVAFASNGKVSSVAIVAGVYDAGTQSCIRNRFKSAHIAPFSAPPFAVRKSISL